MRLERRQAIPLIFAGTAAAVGLVPKSVSAQESQPEIIIDNELKPAQSAPTRALKPVDALKAEIAIHGNRPLSISAATQVHERTLDWASNRGDLSINPQLLKGFYLVTATREPEIIVRANYNPRELRNPFDHQVVQIFYENYPDYPNTEEAARQLLTFYFDPRGLAGTFGGTEVFMNHDYLTNTSRFLGKPDSDPRFMYQGEGPKPARFPVTPVHAQVSTDNHELGHLREGAIPLDPEIIIYLERNSRGQPGEITFEGFQSHFVVQTSATGKDGGKVSSPPEERFNEFFTDHYNLQTLSEAGIPGMPGYERQPYEHHNFALMLKLSDVSLANFRKIQELHDPKTALVALAMGARTPQGRLFDNSSSVQGMLDFIMQRVRFGNFIDWNPAPNNRLHGEMERFYPGIVLEQPQY